MILETERLYLREMKQSDFDDLAEMLQNPNVMYAYEHDFTDEDVQIWLDRQKDIRNMDSDCGRLCQSRQKL